ncbi:MAG: hypothetical protein M1834_001906 [Cirrosporium novae-zelandiae]|nr:MAG: hypothetical protein M1834_001906 [Cirrosporium novae-zelandiae]
MYQSIHNASSYGSDYFADLPSKSSYTTNNLTTMSTEWSPDFCLACDKQTSGQAYCSQACRLADLEKSSTISEPSSPAATSALPWASTTSSGTAGQRRSGFFLPPAIDFSMYKSQSAATTPVTYRSPMQSSNPAGYFSYPSQPSKPALPSAPARTLSPSSSRTSLTSFNSASSGEKNLTDQVRSELQGTQAGFITITQFYNEATNDELLEALHITDIAQRRLLVLGLTPLA